MFRPFIRAIPLRKADKETLFWREPVDRFQILVFVSSFHAMNANISPPRSATFSPKVSLLFT